MRTKWRVYVPKPQQDGQSRQQAFPGSADLYGHLTEHEEDTTAEAPTVHIAAVASKPLARKAKVRKKGVAGKSKTVLKGVAKGKAAKKGKAGSKSKAASTASGVLTGKQKVRKNQHKSGKPFLRIPRKRQKADRVRAVPGPSSQAWKAGNKAGVLALMASPLAARPRVSLNRDYWQWATRNGIRPEGSGFQLEAARYHAGYSEAIRLPVIDWVPLPTEKSVAAILSVTGNEPHVAAVLHQLDRLSLQEIVVVVNGVDDDTFTRLHNHPAKPILVHYDQAIGYDVGRAIGAKISATDILLFVDSDIVIPAEKLVPFVKAVDKGTGLALNQISPYVGNFNRWDSVTIVKTFVNRALGRSDLGANSLTAVPHAMSRSAAEAIGYANLAVPPVAQVQAIRAGLAITAPASVDVITANRLRGVNQGQNNAVESLITGDHLEALSSVMELTGERLDYPDWMRERQPKEEKA
jgi:hypothetical protein